MLAVRRGAVLSTVLAAIVISTAGPAFADDVICDPSGCVIKVRDPGFGGPGSGGGGRSPGGGVAQCATHRGEPVPCHDPGFGWWNPDDECYYRLADPQPPAADPAWQGHRPGDGAIYDATCPGVAGTGTGLAWRATAPAGFGGSAPPAATLAQQALAQMRFPNVAIGTAPAEHTYVGLATWMWIPASQWRVLSATAAIGPRSVTLTATPMSVTWDMGEGQVTCAGPGIPWVPGAGEASPCSYTYRASSIHQPGAGNDRAYAVRATVRFALHWQCQGNCDEAAGDLAAQDVPSATTRLRVLERQSVVIGAD